MFAPKFEQHKYKDEIIKRFDLDVPITEIREWLKSLGEEHALSGDTLRKYKKRHEESIEVSKEVEKVKDEFGECSDIEGYLLETITQCRTRKRSSTISGKDFQYYDQQMQNAIKLLNEIRGSGNNKMSIAEVFAKLGEGLDDTGTETT